MSQALPLLPMEDHSEVDAYSQPLEDPVLPVLEQGPCGSLCWNKFLVGSGSMDLSREKPMLEQVLCCSGGPMLEQAMPEELYPVEGADGSAVCELQPMGRTHIGEVCGCLCLLGGSLEQGRSLDHSSPQARCEVLTAAPIPCTTVGKLLGSSKA